MANLKCPCCNNKSISLVKRLLLTPLGKLKCNNCGSKLGLPPISSGIYSLVQYAVVLYLALLLFVYQTIGYFVLLAIVWVGFEIIQLVIPMVCKEKTT